jgi:isocitrate dehydrogenase
MSDQKISIRNGKLIVPENPTIPFIEGDGTGIDIWPVSQHVFDKALRKLTEANAKSIGRKYWQVKSHLTKR